MRARRETVDLAGGLEPVLTRVRQVRDGQRAAWHGETEANAVVDVADEDLEETVEDLEAELRHIERDRDSPRYRRYFPQGPSAIVKLGLASTIELIAGWPEALAVEPEARLQEIGTTLATRIEVGRRALAGRTSAATRRASHRASEIFGLIDDVNATRLGLLSDLMKAAIASDRDAAWASRFFRRATSALRSRRARRDVPGEPLPT